MVYYKSLYLSPIGSLSLIATPKGLRGIWFEDQKYFERGVTDVPMLADHPVLRQTMALLDTYFSGCAVDLSTLPIDVSATPFQKAVWQILQEIPYGQTLTYGQIAQRLGIASGQAVGGAVGKNPISILIPCHRVVGSQGQLTGYAGGLEKKRWLLAHESSMKKEEYDVTIL
ncbi:MULTISPECIES: methylated-DNA--[protein]-cysteine S-methyltransferase [unclassified Streptococcus]|uniref:methylated-DNA--[protein]-cysteine S-methyltransferase n=1 Tax=unclassified Streptococcus TaxID=2608887 RepID=UPI0010720E11|nr:MULTISPECIES: methylated-DNA--[protein]-cysteine S-methyltransferase [unclassified Streptococcus]MBF0787460.1 methylated-DNA--[protein]-cysteine S-methyltransferase [Streptococcus sp. 19428wC2_LYSM12]MCQ9212020.1 methylated-DNA--[protein]-cysteine S-methyltransferase [Streptococcus sp. B01]MCQ9213349.1 methylated-DNA--[protein]-cysteine S-methyltransferase [Streptococcus sp. O1]TFV05543.1 methylated-DNA--[protein]-cysteine S-methyltransferase [Streptococcus sp. LYSM12]